MGRQTTEVMRPAAAGFKADADRIIQTYVQEQTFDIAPFLELWKEMSFSLVYIGRETEREVNELTHEMFHITLSYLTLTAGPRQKTAAIYLLSGIYWKQPFKQKYRIRINEEQWRQVVELQNFGRREKYRTLQITILKLMMKSAFHVVIFYRRFGPLSEAPIPDSADELPSRLNELRSFVREFTESGFLEQLDVIHNKYEDMKQKLGYTGSRELQLLDKSIYLTMLREFNQLATCPENQIHKLTFSSDPSTSAGTSDIGLRRSMLKDTSFKSLAEDRLAASRRKILSETEAFTSATEMDEPKEGNDATENEDNKEKKRRRKRKRVPKGQRPRGRPKKCTIKSESEEEEEILPDKPKSNLPEGRFRTEKPRRLKYHYESSEEITSESFEDEFLELNFEDN